MQDEMKHVVIVGVGFAGLFAAKKFFGKKVKVTVIDRHNYHTFNPLLYQVGAGELDPEQVVYPVRSVIRKKSNIDFFMAEVSGVKFNKQAVVTDRGDIPYDYLILAPGSGPNFFNTKGAEANSAIMKTLDDSISLKNRILALFEKASGCDDPEVRKRCLTFVVIGGGPTGVEFAGAFAELVNGPFKKDYHDIKPEEVNIIVIDVGKRILPMYNEKSSAYATKVLRKMGVKVLTEKQVTAIDKDAVRFSTGEVIKSETILWTAGVSGKKLKTDIKIPERRDLRIQVENTLRFPGYENVFICGDLAFLEQDGIPLPMNAPVASQQGGHAAMNILRTMENRELKPFRYADRGAMVTIGRNSAIAKYKKLEVRGFIAWIMWIFIHIFYLIGFRNKIFVMINWARDYIMFERSGRMIIPSVKIKK